ncbi:MAG: hypothetical protein H8K04_07695 [Nitrospira sp.]
MNGERLDPPTTHEYKGRMISLVPQQGEDGTWRCHYVFIRFSPIQSAYITNYPDGAFATRQESEGAALHKAKKLIDSVIQR